MKNLQPLIDPATGYRIEVRGQIDVEWLQSFDSSVESSAGRLSKGQACSLLSVHTDQAGLIGLLRKLHGLGVAILKVEVIWED